jgi:uncharacterized protein (DUF433 family)
MGTDADALIDRHIVLGPEATGPVGARVAGAGVRVWALIGYLRANEQDIARAAADYEISVDAVRAALAYYDKNRDAIDARLAGHASLFAAAM